MASGTSNGTESQRMDGHVNSQAAPIRRVLLLVPSMAGAGGTERMVHSLSGLLADESHEVHQASFDAPGTRRHFTGAAPFHPLGPIPRLPLPLRPLAYLLAARRLRRLKRALRIDITISNLWGADVISALSRGADHKVALCHINIVGNPTNRLMVKFLPLVRAVYRCFEKVIAVNESLADELSRLYRLPSSRVFHIHNFADPPAAASVLPADGVTRFVWCGRFNPEKNVEGLLHAWAAFAALKPGPQLVLVGDGPLLSDMRSLARQLRLHAGNDIGDTAARLVFAGQVDNPAGFMRGARALLLTSRAEGLPMVVLEALAAGIPVLASDCPSGGTRTALVGSGSYDPARARTEETPAGLLLPVPDASVPATMTAWSDALLAACDDHELNRRWQHGALDRAALFSSQAARARWMAALAGLGANA